MVVGSDKPERPRVVLLLGVAGDASVHDWSSDPDTLRPPMMCRSMESYMLLLPLCAELLRLPRPLRRLTVRCSPTLQANTLTLSPHSLCGSDGFGDVSLHRRSDPGLNGARGTPRKMLSKTTCPAAAGLGLRWLSPWTGLEQRTSVCWQGGGPRAVSSGHLGQSDHKLPVPGPPKFIQF